LFDITTDDASLGTRLSVNMVRGLATGKGWSLPYML